MYMCVCIYIYIYIHTVRCRAPRPVLLDPAACEPSAAAQGDLIIVFFLFLICFILNLSCLSYFSFSGGARATLL